MAKKKSLYERLKNNELATHEWEVREEPYETYSDSKILEDLKYFADPYNNIFEEHIEYLKEEIDRWTWIKRQPTDAHKERTINSLKQAKKEYAQIKRILQEHK